MVVKPDFIEASLAAPETLHRSRFQPIARPLLSSEGGPAITSGGARRLEETADKIVARIVAVFRGDGTR